MSNTNDTRPIDTDPLRTYQRPEVTADTDIRVCGHRTISPWGTLIHTTSGANSLQWLQVGSANAGAPASADALIAREGTQYLITPDGRYAYHAGQSIWQFDRYYAGDEVSQALL